MREEQNQRAFLFLLSVSSVSSVADLYLGKPTTKISVATCVAAESPNSVSVQVLEVEVEMLLPTAPCTARIFLMNFVVMVAVSPGVLPDATRQRSIMEGPSYSGVVELGLPMKLKAVVKSAI